MAQQINKPLVSIIMPSLNEAEYIRKAINTLLDDFVRANAEILIADGMSTDGTREIIKDLIQKGCPIHLLDNKKKYQVYGLNLAIKEAKGNIIVRTDAHASYPKGYVQKCVELLEKTGAMNAGGIMKPKGVPTLQSAVASAMQHPLGVGDAKFHLGNFSGWVDTVYLGAFPKKVFNQIGLFDTNCRTNEDAEFNLRILKAGGKIYLDNSLKIEYTPRASLSDLAHQYFNYGKGRSYTTLRHKKITSWRQVAPVILVLGLITSLILGFWIPAFFSVIPLYWFTLTISGLLTPRKKHIPFPQRIILGTLFFIMHTSWGVGFLSYLLSHPFIKTKVSSQ